MLATLWMASALAGSAEIKVDIDGSETRHIFIDGKLEGEARSGKPLRVTLATGNHEVAVAHDERGRWLVCIGEIDLKRDATVEATYSRCTGITKTDEATGPTVREGGLVNFTGAEAEGSVKLGDRGKVLEAKEAVLANVPAGTHDVSGPNCEGTITVGKGTTSSIVFTDGGCKGLDEGGKKKKKKKKK